MATTQSNSLRTRRLKAKNSSASKTRRRNFHARNGFHATVYSMNTLLVQKGIYSPEEFEFQFRQFAQKNLH
jgi:hypothetical protein